jgi:hypothetical protein
VRRLTDTGFRVLTTRMLLLDDPHVVAFKLLA